MTQEKNPMNRSTNGALNAANAAVLINAEGAGSIHFEIDTGTLSGTVVIEATLDDVNWFSVNGIQLDGTISSSFTAFGIRGTLAVGGWSQVRLRVSAYTSGTSNARLAAAAVDSVTRLLSGPTGTSAIQVQGLAAHDAVAIGNPVLNGAQMETMADSAPGTRAGTDGDVVKLASTDGALYVIPTGPQAWNYHENSAAALTDAVVHAAPGAGLSLYVTDIVVSVGAATALNFFFEEGVTTVFGPHYLEAVIGGRFVIHLGTPKKITPNTALTVTTSAAIAHAIDITGFIAPG